MKFLSWLAGPLDQPLNCLSLLCVAAMVLLDGFGHRTAGWIVVGVQIVTVVVMRLTRERVE